MRYIFKKAMLVAESALIALVIILIIAFLVFIS